MIIDKTLLKTLIDDLKITLRKIEGMEVDLEEVLRNEDVQDILDRRMQVTIETCIDIATHLAAGLELPRKERASDVFLLLGENEIISKEIARKMAGAVGLRNILVHEYAAIDYRLAYSDLDEKIKDVKSFGREILEFLEKQT